MKRRRNKTKTQEDLYELAPILQNVDQGSFAAGPVLLTPETQQGAPLLEIDQPRFKAEFNRYSFLVRHRLVQARLFSIPALIELSQRLPEESIKYNSGGIPVGTGLYEAPATGLGKEETLRRIGDCKSWMV